MIMDEFTMLNLELVEFMDDLVRVFDKNGFIVYTNSSMKKFVGNEEGKFCFFSDLDVSNNKEKFSTLKCISPISDNREIVTDTVSTLDKVFFVKSSPIYDDKGEYWGSIEVFRDITAESKLGNSLIKYKENTINDMTIAADIQRSLLLKLSHVDGINFEYKYISSDELSGDFFDVIELTENKVCVYMADVMGHGISASMITMFIKFSVRGIVKTEKIEHPAEILKALAKEFSKLNIEMYFTIFLGIYDRNSCEFEYSNAGHNSIPILFNNNKNILLGLSGLPITWISWMFRERPYSVGKIKLYPGDTLLFYTDGVTETKNKLREEFGEEGLLSVINENKENISDRELLDVIVKSVDNFRFGDQEDDIALLSMRIL